MSRIGPGYKKTATKKKTIPKLMLPTFIYRTNQRLNPDSNGLSSCWILIQIRNFVKSESLKISEYAMRGLHNHNSTKKGELG